MTYLRESRERARVETDVEPAYVHPRKLKPKNVPPFNSKNTEKPQEDPCSTRTVPEFAMCKIRPPPPALLPLPTIVYLCLSVIAPISYSLAIDFPYLRTSTHSHLRFARISSSLPHGSRLRRASLTLLAGRKVLLNLSAIRHFDDP